MDGAISATTDEPDPFIGECPAWCGDDHRAVDDQHERYHYGPALVLPVQSLGARELSAAGEGARPPLIFRDLCMSLERLDRYRDPRIQISGFGLTELDLSIDEAEQLVLGLTRMIGETLPTAVTR